MMKRLGCSLIALCLLAACITEIDFEADDTQFIAINGVISNNPTERLITFYENVPTNAGISGKLLKDGQVIAELEPVKRRSLRVPDVVRIEEGAAYQLEIATSEGEVYMTQPQTVLPPRRPASLSMDIESRLLEGKDGTLFEQNFINVFAEMQVAEQEAPFFVRLQMDESWAFMEVDDPRVEGDSIFLCYIERDISTFPSAVWSSGNQAPGLKQVLVASRVVDNSFLRKHYFNVYTYPITELAHTYYRNAQKIIQNSGTLLDEIPAALKGNVFDKNDPERQVFGLVEFAIPDTIRLPVNGLTVRIPDPCGVDQPCANPRPDGTLPFCECADCLLIPGSSYQKPSYFE